MLNNRKSNSFNSALRNTEESLKSLAESLEKLAARRTTSVNRPLNSKLRLLILKNVSSEVSEGVIMECLADTIENDVMAPHTTFSCNFREGFFHCCTSKIEEETKCYLQSHGIDIKSSIFDAAIILVLERQADALKLQRKTVATNGSSKKVTVEFAGNNFRSDNKSYNPRSLLKRKHL